MPPTRWTGPDGKVVDADTIAYLTATNLNGEFAAVTSTAELLGRAGNG